MKFYEQLSKLINVRLTKLCENKLELTNDMIIEIHTMIGQTLKETFDKVKTPQHRLSVKGQEWLRDIIFTKIELTSSSISHTTQQISRQKVKLCEYVLMNPWNLSELSYNDVCLLRELLMGTEFEESLKKELNSHQRVEMMS